MATFYYNKNSGDSYQTQWGKYIQTRAFVGDIQESVKHQTREFNDSIKVASKKQAEAIQQSTTAICGTLERGFSQVTRQIEEVNRQLGMIHQSIVDLHAMLDWKTDLMIEELKISNIYMGNIARLLQIPDSQLQRAYHVEQGLIYLKNAIEEGSKSGFYEEAVDEFQKAENIEKKDFFTLHQLGLIHLYSIKHLDIERAENYFFASSRYARAFGLANPINTQTILRGDVDQSYKNTLNKDTLYQEASTSLVYASRCCYILQKFKEGITYAEEAVKLVPHNPEAGLQLAKMLTVSGNPTEAAEVLERVIEINRYYSIKVLTDQDLISSPQIQNKLNDISRRTLKEANEKFNDCKENIVSDSFATTYLNNVHISLTSNDFLGAKQALDQLNEKRLLQLNVYSVDNKTIYKEPFKRQLITSFTKIDETLYDFIHKEAEHFKIKMELLNYIEADFLEQHSNKQKKFMQTIKISSIVAGIALFATVPRYDELGIFGIITYPLMAGIIWGPILTWIVRKVN